MGHGIFSGHNRLNVTMRLAGCHIDVVLKLQREAQHQVSLVALKAAAQALDQSRLPQRAAGTADHTGQQNRTHLAGDWIQWQKVKIWQVEEDRLHFWHPA